MKQAVALGFLEGIVILNPSPLRVILSLSKDPGALRINSAKNLAISFGETLQGACPELYYGPHRKEDLQ